MSSGSPAYGITKRSFGGPGGCAPHSHVPLPVTVTGFALSSVASLEPVLEYCASAVVCLTASVRAGGACPTASGAQTAASAQTATDNQPLIIRTTPCSLLLYPCETWRWPQSPQAAQAGKDAPGCRWMQAADRAPAP